MPGISFQAPSCARRQGNDDTPDRRSSHLSHWRVPQRRCHYACIIKAHVTALDCSHINDWSSLWVTYNKSQKLPNTATRITISLQLPVFHRPFICHPSLQKRWRICQNKLHLNGLGVHFIVNTNLFFFVLYGLLQKLELTMETSTEVWGSMTVNANTMSYGMWHRVVRLIGGIVLEECSASILWCLNNEGSRFLRKAGIYYHPPHQKDDSLNAILLLGVAY